MKKNAASKDVFEKLTAKYPYAVGNAMQYKAEHFGEIYLQNGKLTADELKFFMEIFQDWKRDYDAPLADEISAFKIMIKEAQA